jgi:hypothetical protein
MKTTKRPSVKMTKQQAAEALALALNLLNDLHARFGDEFSTRQENDYYEAIACLKASEDVRADFANNGTLDSRDLI